MGLLGSPHCLGMCGGIVSAFGISMQGQSKSRQMWLVASYHIGRLISYMILGVVASLLGATLLAPFMTHNSLPRILLGGAIIFASLLMLGLPVLKNIEKLGLGLWTKLSPLRAKLFPLTTTPKALGAGLLWGFLPCGLVYGAIGVAISMGTAGGTQADTSVNVLNGVLFMLAFGLGTLPMLVATQTVVGVLQRMIAKFSLRQASGVLMLLSGLFVAIPAITHSHHDHHGHGGHADHNHHANHAHHGEHTTDNHSADHASHAHHNHDHANHSHSDTHATDGEYNHTNHDHTSHNSANHTQGEHSHAHHSH